MALPDNPSRTVRRRLALTGTAVLATGVALFGPLTESAWAHVGVNAGNPVQGAVTVVDFQVPTEKDVPTTKVVVAMPTDTPLSEVLVKPQVGWTYALTMGKPAVAVKDDDGDVVASVVTRVTWTATAGGIKPNEYNTFEVLAGPLPAVSTLEFKVLQTYKDGSVVSWIDEQVKGAPEPDFPAPVLAVNAASSSAQAAVDGSASAGSAGHSSAGSSSTATVLGGTGLGLGVLALAAAGYAVIRTRRQSTG